MLMHHALSIKLEFVQDVIFSFFFFVFFDATSQEVTLDFFFLETEFDSRLDACLQQVYIHTHIYTYIHIYTHIYIYIYVYIYA